MKICLFFAEIMRIEEIATTRTSAAIVPNSGITNVPMISISSEPYENGIVKVQNSPTDDALWLVSSPSTNMKNPYSSVSITSFGSVIVSSPSQSVLIDTINDLFSVSGVKLWISAQVKL